MWLPRWTKPSTRAPRVSSTAWTVSSTRSASRSRLAAQKKRPTIYTDREYVLAGGLMALGVGHLEGYYRAAEYVDKILRGANPADLSVALPTKLTFSVSRSALQSMDLTLPEEITDRVTEWLP